MSDGSEGSASGLELRYLSGTSGAGSLSVERHAMKEALQSVRNTLNTLVEPASMATPQRAPAAVSALPLASAGHGSNIGGHSLSGPPPETLLGEIAARLGSIEHMYGDITSRLVRMDGRVQSNERSVRELQHLSTGAMHETARLVDYVGHRSAVPGTMTPGRHGAGLSFSRQAAQHEHMASTPSAARGLDYVPSASQVQLTSTVQLHASQIHKLIAGLDFLEQHIIRQDTVIEEVQKQVAVAAQNRSPSELSLRVHDMSQLLNKLRAHLYKVEKRSAGGETTLKELTARLSALEQRSALGGTDATLDVPLGSSASTNPLFADAAYPQRGLTAMAVDGDSGTHVTCADLDELRQQLQAELRDAVAEASQGSTQALEQQIALLQENLATARQEAVAARQEAESAQQAVTAARQAAETAEATAAAATAGVAATVTSVAAETALAAVADLAGALNEVTSKAYDEQLVALQERVHALDEELRAGQADLRDYAVSLHSQVQDAYKAEMQERIEAVLSTVRDSMQADMEQVTGELDTLSAQVDGCIRSSAQLSDLVSSSLAIGEEALKESLRESLRLEVEDMLASSLAVQVDNLRVSLSDSLAVDEEALKESIRGEMSDLVAGSLAIQEESLRAVVSDSLAAGEEALKGVLATQTEDLNAMLQKLAAEVYEVKGAGQKEAAGLRDELQVLEVQCQAEREGVAVVGRQVMELANRLEVTLAMAEEARNLAQEHGQQLTACLDSNTDIKADLEGLEADQERLKEAYANLILDLGELRALAGDCAAKAEAAASQAAAAEAVAAEAHQAAQPETLQARVEGLFISRDNLRSIFAAREDMTRAVEKLEGVFMGAQDLAATKPAITGTSTSARSAQVAISTKVSTAQEVYDVPGSQAASAIALTELSARQSDMQSKLDLLLYRWDQQAVRHDQLSAVSQATINLEVYVKQQLAGLHQQLEQLQQEQGSSAEGAGAKQQPVTVTLVVSEPASNSASSPVADGEDSLEARIDDVEEQVSLLREAISTEVKATQDSAADVLEAVHDLQLMVLELRSEGVGRLLSALQEEQAPAAGTGEAGTHESEHATGASEPAGQGDAGNGGGSGAPQPAAAADTEYSFVSPRGWDSPRGRSKALAAVRRLSIAGGARRGSRAGDEALLRDNTDRKVEEQAAQIASVQAVLATLSAEVADLKTYGAGSQVVAARGSMHASSEREAPRQPMLLPMPADYARSPGEQAGKRISDAIVTVVSPAMDDSIGWQVEAARLQRQLTELAAAVAADRATWPTSAGVDIDALQNKQYDAQRLEGQPADAQLEADETQEQIAAVTCAASSDLAENADGGASTVAAYQKDALGLAVEAANAAVQQAIAAAMEAKAAAEEAKAVMTEATEARAAAAAVANDPEHIADKQAAGSGGDASCVLLHDLATRLVELAGRAAALQAEQDSIRSLLEASAPGWDAAATGWAASAAKLELVEATAAAARAAALQAAGAAAESSAEATAAAAAASVSAAAAQAAAAKASEQLAAGKHAESSDGAESVSALALKVQEVQWGLKSMREGMEGMGEALGRLEAQVRDLEDDGGDDEDGLGGAAGGGSEAGGGRGRRLQALQSIVRRVEGQVLAHDQFLVDLMLQGGEADSGAGAVTVKEGEDDVQQVAKPSSPSPKRRGPPSPKRQAALQAALAATAAVEELGAKVDASMAAAAATQEELVTRVAALEGRMREAEQQVMQGLAQAVDSEVKVASALAGVQEREHSVLQALGSFGETEARLAERFAALEERNRQIVAESLASAGEEEHRFAVQLAAIAADLDTVQQWQQTAAAASAAATPVSAADVAAKAEELRVVGAKVGQLEQLLTQQQALTQHLSQQLNLQVEQQQLQLTKQTEQQLQHLTQQLNLMQQQQQQQPLPAPSSNALDDGTGWGSLLNSALETKVADHGKALHLLRSRFIALQEVVDGTRESIAELRGGQGSVAARMEVVERAVHEMEAAVAKASLAAPQQTMANGTGATNSSGSVDGAAMAALASEVTSLATSVAALQSHGLDASHALEQVVRLAPRVGEAEATLTNLSMKISELAASVSGGEVEAAATRAAGRNRMRRIEAALRDLLQHMSDITSIQKPSSKNPFAAIAPAGMNPAVLVLEQRFEALRTALCEFSQDLADDCCKAE